MLKPASWVQKGAGPSSSPILPSVLPSEVSLPGRCLCSGVSRDLVDVCWFFLSLAVGGCHVVHLTRYVLSRYVWYTYMWYCMWYTYTHMWCTCLACGAPVCSVQVCLECLQGHLLCAV